MKFKRYDKKTLRYVVKIWIWILIILWIQAIIIRL
jgi:hypothetical protein